MAMFALEDCFAAIIVTRQTFCGAHANYAFMFFRKKALPKRLLQGEVDWNAKKRGRIVVTR